MEAKITSKNLADDITIPDDVPKIILGIAPCRSSTTAQLRVFSSAGIESWYQPIKALLRYRLSNRRSEYRIPNIDSIFLKETIGPYTQEESTVNPLEILLEAGIRIETLSVVISVRKALATACSWVEQFDFNKSADELIDNLVLAFNTVNQIAIQVDSLGINNVVFDYSVLEKNCVEGVLDKLFDLLDITPDEGAFNDWTQLPAMGTPESGIFFADEPALYSSGDFHIKVAQSSGLKFYPKRMSRIIEKLSYGQVLRLIDGGVFEIYDRLRLKSADDFKLDISESTEVEGYFEKSAG